MYTEEGDGDGTVKKTKNKPQFKIHRNQKIILLFWF